MTRKEWLEENGSIRYFDPNQVAFTNGMCVRHDGTLRTIIDGIWNTSYAENATWLVIYDATLDKKGNINKVFSKTLFTLRDIETLNLPAI